MDNSYIKNYRKMIEWEWYKDIPVNILFNHLLRIVNYSDKKWQGRDVLKGEIITSFKNLSSQTGLSTQEIRTAISKLKSTNELTSESTTTFTHIKVTKWNEYQVEKDEEQQTSNKRATTTKEGNKVISISNIVSNDEVYMQAGHLSITHDEFSKLEKEFGAEKSDETVQKILNYRKNTKYKSLYLTAITWLRREAKKESEPAKKVERTFIYEE